MKKLLLSIIGILVFTFNVKGQEYLDDIMLQSFGWDEFAQPRITAEGGLYEFYYNRSANLKANGFDMIWLPPPSASTGGVGYFPTELFNFSQTSWGTEAQLKKMLTRMNADKLYPIADIVANHRSGTNSWTNFTNPTWGCDAIVIDDEATAEFDKGTPGVGCRPSGAKDTGEGFGGSRDMDHTNLTVRNGYKEFLNRLKALGFKGWRWDVAKGFSPNYFGEYIGASQPYYSVGEYWDGNVAALKNWINGTYTGGANISGTFDFALYYTLSRIIQENPSNNYATLSVSGRMAGLAGEAGFEEKAVTFVDNHDTFVHNSAYQGNNIMVAYAYILTHPGIPSVFAPHYYGGTYTKDGVTRNYGSGNAEAINKLTTLRKATGINAKSSITIDKAEAGLYAAYIKKTSTDPEPVVAMKIGQYTWAPSGSGWILSASGTNYSVWTKTAVNTPPTISISPTATTFVAGTTQNITITATDDSGTAPTIRYTTDGSEPTANSTIYTAPIALTKTTTIKAAAFDNEGLSSGTIERTYTFNSPKTIVVRFKPDGSGWAKPYIHYWSAQPSGSLPDANWGTPVAMTADPNNAGWYMFTFNNITSVNILFRNGETTGTPGVTQTNDLNNITSDKWFVWKTSAPFAEEVTCPTPATNVSTSAIQPTCAVPTGTITFASIAGYSYSIDNGNTWSTNNIFKDLAPGTYTLVQRNAAGCLSPTTSLVINAVPETITLTTKDASLDIAGKSAVNLTPQQVVNSATTSCGSAITYTLSQSSFSATGVYSVTVTAKSAGGATVSKTASVTVTDSYSTKSDLFNITTQDETCDTKNNGSIKIEAKENLPYSYSINGGAWTNFTAPTTISSLNGGSYNLCIKLPSGTQFCYVLTIGKPANLTGKIALNGQTAKVEISTGTGPFTIQVGDNFTTVAHTGTFEVPVNSTADKITVTSSKLCEGTLMEVLLEGDVHLYPNPVRDLLHIRGVGNNEIKVSIYSMGGTMVMQRTISAFDQKKIDLKSLASGMYLITIQNGKNTISKKIIKQ